MEKKKLKLTNVQRLVLISTYFDVPVANSSFANKQWWNDFFHRTSSFVQTNTCAMYFYLKFVCAKQKPIEINIKRTAAKIYRKKHTHNNIHWYFRLSCNYIDRLDYIPRLVFHAVQCLVCGGCVSVRGMNVCWESAVKIK